MVFTSRERIILTATLLAFSILALDRYLATPLLDRYEQTEARRDALHAELDRADSLLKRSELLAPRWRQMLTKGLQRELAEAESQVLHALGNWAVEVGLEISSLKPERSSENTKLPEITFHVAGTGSMAAVSRFLWLVETAPIPVKLKVLQLGAQQEGTDNLTLQLRLSTLYMAASEGTKGQREGRS